MNILAGADFHGDHDVYQWFVALAASAKPDAVVLAGDLFGYADGYSTVEEAQRADSDLLAAPLESLGVPMLYIMGNDDQIEMVSSSASVRPLHMASATLGSYRFVGYQFSLPFMGASSSSPRRRSRPISRSCNR